MRTKLSKFALAATLGIAITFTFSCSSPDDGEGGGGGNGNGGGCPDAVTGDNTVTCGGKTYRTVQIGEQRWMAENLDYDAGGIGCEDNPLHCSRCYSNDPANCDKYGRLYNWATTMALPYKDIFDPQINAKHRGICPSGWHIPSDAEWTTLTDYVGDKAGAKLKSTSGWNNNGNGTDDFDFSALPGGAYDGGVFSSIGIHGYWWSATERTTYNAYIRKMNSDSYVYRDYYGKNNSLHSVRCVED